jgi:hypothetical protein
LLIGENLSELDHTAEVLLAEAAPEFKRVESAFANDDSSTRSREIYVIRMTRVTLSTDTWDRDLELVPGTTSVGTVSLLVPALAIAHFSLVFVACKGLVLWINLAP